MKSNKRKIFIIILICVFFAFLIIGSVFLGIYLYKPESPERIVAYLSSEAIVDEHSLEKFDFSKTTHLIYAFAHVDGKSLKIYIENESGFAILANCLQEKYPNVKLMLSVASAWENDGFCAVSRTSENRRSFALQCADYMEKYSIDGIDIDWEYPSYQMADRPICKDCVYDHASLLETLREILPSGSVLSYAGDWNGFLLRHNRLKKVVDFVNVMLYDNSLSDNSPFSRSKNAMYNYCLKGYSKTQLNWGWPFYCRSETPECDYFTYAKIIDLAISGDAQIFDYRNCTYAMYNGNKLSFDTYAQIVKKTKYARKTGYGGVFCWNLAYDRDCELINAIWDVYHENI